jgi:hypothetical protein
MLTVRLAANPTEAMTFHNALKTATFSRSDYVNEFLFGKYIGYREYFAKV